VIFRAPVSAAPNQAARFDIATNYATTSQKNLPRKKNRNSALITLPITVRSHSSNQI
jgi:hypothetical protein